MQQGEAASGERGIVERLEVLDQNVTQNPQLSRRLFVGLGAVVAGELGAAYFKLRHPHIAESTNALSYKPVPHERYVPPTTTTTTTAPPPETVPPPPENQEVKKNPAPSREMPYGEYAKSAELFHDLIPGLDTLHKLFPSAPYFHHIPQQRTHIEMLKQQMDATPEELIRCALNMTFANAFVPRNRISPKMLLWHWTGDHYDSPQGLAESMLPNSVQLYVHSDDVPYQMMPSLLLRAGHAQPVLNNLAVGMEVYTGEYDKIHSPVFSLTAHRTKASIYTAVQGLRAVGLPVNRTTFCGHFAADLIFRNPYYDPYTGTFHEVPGYDPPSIRKFDPPQELMNMVVEKAMVLDAALGLG